MESRAGTPAQTEDLVDLDALIDAYYSVAPDPENPDQRVVFGTSGHRGSSLKGSFNEAHHITTSLAQFKYALRNVAFYEAYLRAENHDAGFLG